MIYTSISQLAGNTKPVYFKFWANCILVKGYKRGIVADLFRRRQVVVSRLFCTLFDKYMSVPVADLNGDTGLDEIKGYLKMLDYFVKNDFGVYTDNPAELAPLSMEYDSPYLSTTMVLKADSDTDRESVLERVKAITRHSVLSLQINDEGHMDIATMRAIGELTMQSTIECIHIYTRFSKHYRQVDFFFTTQNPRFRQIVFMQAPVSKRVKPITENQCVIRFEKESVDFDDCGNVGKPFFVFNQSFFIEGHSCNTCLNRKVSIDKDGNIGNCPLMPHTFGNIMNTSLQEVVSRPDFQRLWNITKDQVEVCKDCEYRYFCTDCRHFVKDRNNLLSQPSKCNYNPYIAKWSDEDGYVPVEKSIENKL